MLEFKCDESYNTRTLVVAGWITGEGKWEEMERRWRRRLREENDSLPPDKQISRYHASDCASLQGEFAGWTQERQLNFVRDLLGIIIQCDPVAVACGVDLNAFFEVFDENDPKNNSPCYTLCIKQIMQEIGPPLQRQDEHIKIFHDHGSWDVDALLAYNSMVDDPAFLPRHHFHSITPLTWRDCIGLQAADLIAFDCFKTTDAKLHGAKQPFTEADFRKSLKMLLGNDIDLHAPYFDRERLIQFRDSLAR